MARKQRLIGVDLFAGAGGMSLGFQQAGVEVAAAIEHDPIHCAAHEFNFPDCATLCRSVADIDGSYIRNNSSIGASEVDVVFGGAPCQGFSLIGKRAFDDPRNELVRHFLRLVVDLNSRYFVFENVRGLTIGKHKQFLEQLIAEFIASGYDVREEYRVLDAVDYGVPQHRQRLFLFGARKGLALPRYPLPSHICGARPGASNGLFLQATPTVADAIGDLPEADVFEELLERDWVHADFGEPSEYASYLRGLRCDSRDCRFPPQFDGSILTSSLRTVHTALSMRRFLETRHGDIEPVSRFLKLDPKGVSNTLRAGTASDRGAFTSPRPIHPASPRCITVREAARLHSYPDWFRFHVTKWHGFRQIGNSVPPLLARAVAAEVVDACGGPPQSSRSLRLGDPALLRLDMSAASKKYRVRSDVIPKRTRVLDEKRYRLVPAREIEDADLRLYAGRT